MNTNDFLSNLQVKYNYSDDMINFLQKAIPALVNYYGEGKKNIILGTLNNCEIHVQKENEQVRDYINQYFGIEKEKDWDIPFLGGAFYSKQLSVKDNKVQSKSIIYIKTVYLSIYKPFDFNKDENMAAIIHEMCHAIKGYGRLKVENGQIVDESGLIKDYYSYDNSTQKLTNISSKNVGIEEALNSYDEAQIMTLITGIPHEFGAYKGMTPVAKTLMQHKELAEVIKKSQFDGSNDWIEFLGEENSNLLINNFDDWVNILYSPISDLMDDRLDLMGKMQIAVDNIGKFVENYTTPLELQNFMQSRLIADKKTMDTLHQLIQYNNQTNTFEQISEQGRSM